MNTGIILLFSCIRPGEAGAFAELLGHSFGEGVAVRTQSATCCNSDNDVNALWQIALSLQPKLIFVLGGSNSFATVARVLIAGQGLTASPIIVAIDRGRPTDFWRCLEMGADDFLTQPWRSEDIIPRAWRLTNTRRGHIVRSDDKRRARLNLIAHFLSLIPYEEVRREKVELPKRSKKDTYDDVASIANRRFVPEKY
jgi:CheY-like chemotaxis protein